MNSIPEKVKFCTEDVLKKLDNVSCKRRHSPEKLTQKKPKLSQRAQWGPPSLENIPYTFNPGISNSKCLECNILVQKIEELKNHIINLQQSLSNVSQENIELKSKVYQSENLRKILHMQLQEYRGPLKIFCRVKPTVNKFIEYPEAGTASQMRSITICKAQTKSSYTFDGIFTEAACQEAVFKDLEPYIQTAIDGGKVCIFSYGQTGSGKTYTLEGSDFVVLSEDSGILPRAGALIYKEMSRQNVSNFQIFISCIEVYMDTITDLLSDAKPLKKNNDQISWLPVTCLNELLKVIYNASQKRITRETHQNVSSSRSHTVYQIRIEGTDNKGAEIKGKLSVIDLAGSERANTDTFAGKTSDEIEKMKKIQEEAKFINQSLSCLKRIFESLSSKNSTRIPPYRENKLTKLLQDQLQYGEVVVIVAISPDNYTESKESLNFGSIVQLAKI
jgi:kinesin family member C1